MLHVNSLAELEKRLTSAISDSLRDMGGNMQKIVREELYDGVYASYAPTEYKRNHSLLGSLDNKMVGNNELVIEHDTSKISAFSLKTGASVAHFLPDIVHNTGAPNIFNKYKYPWMSPRPYMDNTIKRLNSSREHEAAMKKYLYQQGFSSR